MLWGRSGSLCALCRAHLVLDASSLDRESIVGDECHIVSGAPEGPRQDPSFPRSDIDGLENLILLCRVHHKLIDDQAETYSASLLRELKANHEKWVKERLADDKVPERVRIVRIREEIPELLLLVPNAKMMLDLSSDCCGRYDDYPSDLNDEELQAVGAFLQNLSDWGDIGINEPFERIEAQRSIAADMVELERLELRVYAARERQQLRGGVGGPSTFPMLHLKVVRSGDPDQITLKANPSDQSG